MSALTSSTAGDLRGWEDDVATHHMRLQHPDLVPRSTHNETGFFSANPPSDTHRYNNVNIAVPLDIQSSVSVELTHNGKVMELVARYETYSDLEGSDVSQALDDDRPRISSASTIRPFESGLDSAQVSSPSIADVDSSPSGRNMSPRKSIPSLWKTQPRGPILSTVRRAEEREMKRTARSNAQSSLQHTRSSVDLKSTTFLTKEKGESITSPSTPPSARKLYRNKSKASLNIVCGSPTRDNAQNSSALQIPTSSVSPHRSTQLVKLHVRASSDDSTGDTVFHSAIPSPVSLAACGQMLGTDWSPRSFHTAHELPNEIIPPLKLSADDPEQKIVDNTKSHVTTLPRVKVEPSLKPGNKLTATRSAAPKLSLRIPPTSPSIDRRPPFTLGSSSPSRSRIPRRSSDVDPGSKASPLKRTKSAKVLSPTKATTSSSTKTSKNVAFGTAKEFCMIGLPKTPVVAPVRHVRTLDSAGLTPMQLDRQAMVKSYLENVSPSAEQECNSFAYDATLGLAKVIKPADFTATVARMPSDSATEQIPGGSEYSHQTNVSIIEAPSDKDLILEDSAIVYSYKKTGNAEVDVGDGENCEEYYRSQSVDTAGAEAATSTMGSGSTERLRSREYQPSHSLHTLKSSRSSDLRATAAEFVPAPLVFQPVDDSLLFDPFATDVFGIPWVYYMYPVSPMNRFGKKSPRKARTFAGRKKGSTSPQKFAQSKHIDLQHERSATMSDPKAVTEPTAPFATQLDEIARNAAPRGGKKTCSALGSGINRTMPYRGSRAQRNFENGSPGGFGTYGHNCARPAGVPIDATAPFPNPVPPSGRKEYVGYSIMPEKESCGVVNIEKAMEWGGALCNDCDPDH